MPKLLQIQAATLNASTGAVYCSQLLRLLQSHQVVWGHNNQQNHYANKMAKACIAN